MKNIARDSVGAALQKGGALFLKASEPGLFPLRLLAAIAVAALSIFLF